MNRSATSRKSACELEGCGCVARSIDPPGSGLHGLLEQGPEAAITPGASPSSPDGMTPFDGDRKPNIITTTSLLCATAVPVRSAECFGRTHS